MQKSVSVLAAAIALASVTANAAPTPVFIEDATAESYQFFSIDFRKAKPTVIRDLNNEIYPTKAVVLTNDVNQTPIKAGIATFGTNQMYSYWSNFTFKEIKFVNKDLSRAVKQKFLVNFRSPVGLIPGDQFGNVVHVHFDKPVTYFGAWFSGRPDFALTDTVQYVVNNAIVEQNVSSGYPTFIGVEDVDGFTDLDIVPVGGGNQVYLFDKPSYK